MKIIVNGDGFLVGERVTYEQIVDLAGKKGNPTVVYSGPRQGDVQRSGGMHAGCNPVRVDEGMIFSVAHTGNA